MLKEQLKKLRESRKLTKKQVATLLDISERAYLTYEYGEREPRLETLQKLADFYNVSLDYLVGREIGEPETIEKLVSEFNMTALEKEILEGYLDLPDNLRGDFMEFLQKSVQKIQEEQKGS